MKLLAVSGLHQTLPDGKSREQHRIMHTELLVDIVAMHDHSFECNAQLFRDLPR